MQRSDIESVKFYPLNKQGGKILAFASVTFTSGLTVKARVMSGSNGLWVPMESYKKEKSDGTSEYVNLCYFSNKEDSQAFQDAVLELWAKEKQQESAPRSNNGRQNGRSSGRTQSSPKQSAPPKDDGFVHDGDAF